MRALPPSTRQTHFFLLILFNSVISVINLVISKT
jgi:hypothetical protein